MKFLKELTSKEEVRAFKWVATGLGGKGARTVCRYIYIHALEDGRSQLLGTDGYRLHSAIVSGLGISGPFTLVASSIPARLVVLAGVENAHPFTYPLDKMLSVLQGTPDAETISTLVTSAFFKKATVPTHSMTIQMSGGGNPLLMTGSGVNVEYSVAVMPRHRGK